MISKHNRFKGSILVSVCVLWLMYLSLFFLMYSEYRHQQLITSEMKKHYSFLLLENLAHVHLAETKATQGVLTYNIGEIVFTIEKEQQLLEFTLVSGEKKTVKKTAD